MRVAVTGAGTALGKAVLTRLQAETAVTAAVGVDLAEPSMPVALDGSEVVVHCVLEPELSHDEEAAFARTVHASRSLLDAVAKVGARKLIVVSSAMVYGAHPDNELPLAEDAALRANPDFAPAYQLMLVERLVQERADDRPCADGADGPVTVTVLRPAITLGPGIDGFIARHLESARLPLVRGQSAPLQFVHIDDVVAAVWLAVTTDLPGVFNVAADGWLPVTEVCAILGRRLITVPEATAFEAVRWLWESRLWHMPPGALHYLMYPWVVTADRLQAHGWAPTRSNREILREFVEAHHAYLAVGQLQLRRRDLAVAIVSAAALLVLWLGSRLKAKRQSSGQSKRQSKRQLRRQSL